jgi:hypothetical protein
VSSERFNQLAAKHSNLRLKNPAVIVGGVALVAMVGPKRLMRWITKGALLYSTAKRFIRLRQQM